MTGSAAFNSMFISSANPAGQDYLESPLFPHNLDPGEVIPQPGRVGQVLIANEQYFTFFKQKITGACKKISGDIQIIPDSPVKGWVTDDPVETSLQTREAV